MTEPLVAESAEAGRRGTSTQRRALVVGVVLVLVAVAAAFWLVVRSGERTETTTAYCTASAREVDCLLQVGGTVRIDDTTWTQDGAEHTQSRPACLDGHDPEVQVKVGYNTFEAEPYVWSTEVVWVDCDSAVPVP
jgi:ferric-dicitrate binding protein FerR (iron transport regulator)